jgi:hypothetical protein
MDFIATDLRPLAVPIDDVHPDPANGRTGHAIDRIAASLARYGQRKPIVVNKSEENKIEAVNEKHMQHFVEAGTAMMPNAGSGTRNWARRRSGRRYKTSPLPCSATSCTLALLRPTVTRRPFP